MQRILLPPPASPLPIDVLLAGLPAALADPAERLRREISEAYGRRRAALPDFATLTASEAAAFAPPARLLKKPIGSLQARIEQYLINRLWQEQAAAEHAAVAGIAEAVRIAGRERLDWSESDLRELADKLANRAASPALSDGQVIRQAKHWINAPFEVPGKTERAQRARMENPRWWRRLLRKTVLRAVERAFLHAGLVGRYGMRYASDHAAKLRQQGLERQAEWLSCTHAECIDMDGEIVAVPLPSQEEATERKLAEFWAWCAGVQQLAAQDGLEIAMLTLTMDPSYHPNPSEGENSWDGTLPDAANRELGRRWGVIRAALGKEGIALSGFRAAEPHDDGCPHWHLLLIYRPEHRQTILVETLKRFPRKIALRTRDAKRQDRRVLFNTPTDVEVGNWRCPDYPKEGAQAELAVINTAVGSVASYVTKYIIKQTGDNRAGAWRATWGVRGLQWFGIRSALTKWRELRRLKEMPAGDATLVRLWRAASEGDAGGFLTVLGGLACSGRTGLRTGRLTVPRMNAYGEADHRIIGLMIAGQEVVTRPHAWKLVTTWQVTVKPIVPSKALPLVKEVRKADILHSKIPGDGWRKWFGHMVRAATTRVRRLIGKASSLLSGLFTALRL